MSLFRLDWAELQGMEQAMKEYQGNVEEVINDVLHNEAGQLIHDEIKRLMPISNRTWKGKKAPAKTSNSLLVQGGNLSVTVQAQKTYQYLYFSDDGTNTTRHVGKNGVPQEFFKRGGENKKEEILNRCIGRLVGAFEEAI